LLRTRDKIKGSEVRTRPLATSKEENEGTKGQDLNSLPAPPPTAALHSHKRNSDKINPGVHLHHHHRGGHIGWPSINLHPFPNNSDQYMEADFEGLDPEVSPTRRQLHDQKLKLREFRRLS
jgi:hypothetical protein